MGTLNQRKDADAVLSTVRRIVHEESEASVAGVVEKLLLTPALRVDGAPAANAPQERKPTPLELRIAELERAVGGTPGEWEPDGSEGGNRETPTEFVMDHPARAETVAQAVEAVPPVDVVQVEIAPVVGDLSPIEETTHETPGPLEGTLVDEDQLKEMVAAMVRAELQGPLGERITRNVRKLVRREIHRALLTRDLD